MNTHDGNCLWTEMKAIFSEIIFMILESEKRTAQVLTQSSNSILL